MHSEDSISTNSSSFSTYYLPTVDFSSSHVDTIHQEEGETPAEKHLTVISIGELPEVDSDLGSCESASRGDCSTTPDDELEVPFHRLVKVEK